MAAGCAANPTLPVVATATAAHPILRNGNYHSPPLSYCCAHYGERIRHPDPTPAYTPTFTPTPTLAATSTLVPLALPTRLPAKSWKQWPVIPELTNRARAIYQQGRADQ